MRAWRQAAVLADLGAKGVSQAGLLARVAPTFPSGARWSQTWNCQRVSGDGSIASWWALSPALEPSAVAALARLGLDPIRPESFRIHGDFVHANRSIDHGQIALQTGNFRDP